MNGEDFQELLDRTAEYDAIRSVELAIKQQEYAAKNGYNINNGCSRQSVNYDVDRCLDSLFNWTDETAAEINEMHDEIADIKSKVSNIAQSPFVVVNRNSGCTLQAANINQIQLTDEQFKMLLDKLDMR